MPGARTSLLSQRALWELLHDYADRIASGRFDQRDADTFQALRGEVALRALRS